MRYTVDVGPGDAGIRVTIRRRLPEGGLGDVLGQLLSWAGRAADGRAPGWDEGHHRRAGRGRRQAHPAAARAAPVTGLSRERFAEVVRLEPADVGLACLLIGCETEPDLDVDACLKQLDDLAAHAQPLVRAARRWRRDCGRPWGHFGGSGRRTTRTCGRRCCTRCCAGGAGCRSCCRCCGARWLTGSAQWPCRSASPGHVMVCLGDPLDEHVVVDPFHGGRGRRRARRSGAAPGRPAAARPHQHPRAGCPAGPLARRRPHPALGDRAVAAAAHVTRWTCARSAASC